MLRSLNIRDFVIVDRIELEFAAGFTALTGETGAGKSILIDALALALGERADASVVRPGAERAEIAAEFELDARSPLKRWLADNDLTGDDNSCLMRRVIEAGGRSRAFINGRAATQAQFREAGEQLIDIHGQHEHQALMRAAENCVSNVTPSSLNSQVRAGVAVSEGLAGVAACAYGRTKLNVAAVMTPARINEGTRRAIIMATSGAMNRREYRD